MCAQLAQEAMLRGEGQAPTAPASKRTASIGLHSNLDTKALVRAGGWGAGGGQAGVLLAADLGGPLGGG